MAIELSQENAFQTYLDCSNTVIISHYTSEMLWGQFLSDLFMLAVLFPWKSSQWVQKAKFNWTHRNHALLKEMYVDHKNKPVVMF